jgi:hypothetical protein
VAVWSRVVAVVPYATELVDASSVVHVTVAVVPDVLTFTALIAGGVVSPGGAAAVVNTGSTM